MARYGYSYVTDRGFTSFSRELFEGAWEGVSIEAHDSDADPPIARASLVGASLPVVWKLRATWEIRGLLRAMGSATASELIALDREWDSSQRALDFALLALAEHEDADHRAAAGRLRTALLMGAGTGQTQLSYEKEVDFGTAQLELARKEPLSADVTTADLAPHLERIREATDALAAGLGRGSGRARPVSRTRRIRDALAACSTTFNSIHDTLAWLIEHTAPGEERQHLEALHAPFLALLERYPPRPKTASEEVVDEPAVTSA